MLGGEKGGGGMDDMRRGDGRGEDFGGYVKMRRWMRLLYTDDRDICTSRLPIG
jgi:hypothetical protein